MNRRNFFRSLFASAVCATATRFLGEVAVPPVDPWAFKSAPCRWSMARQEMTLASAGVIPAMEQETRAWARAMRERRVREFQEYLEDVGAELESGKAPKSWVDPIKREA